MFEGVGRTGGALGPYPLTDAAVALEYGLVVGALFQRTVHPDGGCHGSAVTASVVGFAVLEAGRVGLRAGMLRRNIWGAKLAAVGPGRGC